MRSQTSTVLLFFGALLSAANAAQSEWAQCGGLNWTGDTTCASGLTCVVQNPYYYQCLASSGSSTALSSSTVHPGQCKTSPASSSRPAVQAVSPALPAKSSNPASSGSGSGATYKATVTWYGAGDSLGSPNCQAITACGFYPSPGFSAAISQNFYGVGPGAGAGPACGTCWKLVGEADSSGNPLTNAGTSVVVMVNNLCPAENNGVCSQSGLTGTNQYGANVNFDLCSDSGARAAFFGNDGVGLAVGTATQVDCSEWSGSIVH